MDDGLLSHVTEQAEELGESYQRRELYRRWFNQEGLVPFVLEACKWKDEHSRQILPPPDEPYIRYLLDKFRTEETLIVVKSRQVMVSWMMYSVILWELIRTGNCSIALVPQTDDEGRAHIKNRFAETLWDELPKWLKSVYKTNPVEGQFTVEYRRGQKWGSWLASYAKGEHKLRSHVHTIVAWDEMGSQPLARKTWKAAVPTAGSRGAHGGRLWGVGTPIPSSKHHELCNKAIVDIACQVARGEIAPLTVKVSFDDVTYEVEIKRPMIGVAEYPNPEVGGTVVVVHYTADRMKRDPAWAAKESRRFGGLSSPDWLQEYELRFDAQKGKLVYPAYSPARNLVDTVDIKSDWPLTLSADWGYTAPTAIHMYTKDPVTKRHYVVGEFYSPLSQTGISEFKSEIVARAAEIRGMSIDDFNTETFDDPVGDPEDPSTMAQFADGENPIYFRGNEPGATWKLNNVLIGEYRTNQAFKPTFVCCKKRHWVKDDVGICTECGKENPAEPLLLLLRGAAPELEAQIPVLQRKEVEEGEELTEKTSNVPRHATDSLRYHVQSDQSWLEDTSQRPDELPAALRVPFHRLSIKDKLWAEAKILAARSKAQMEDAAVEHMPGEIVFGQDGNAFMEPEDDGEYVDDSF